MKFKLTQERLKETLHYDPETGIFCWNKYRHGCRKSLVAGHKNERGYIKILISGKQYLAHRLVWLYIEGYWPENIEIDHIDRDTSNNKWNNLRLVSRSCNMQNRRLCKINKSGITGVRFSDRDNLWIASIGMNSKCIYLGGFKNIVPAVRARWEAEKKYNYNGCCTTSSAFLFLSSNQNQPNKHNVKEAKNARD